MAAASQRQTAGVARRTMVGDGDTCRSQRVRWTAMTRECHSESTLDSPSHLNLDLSNVSQGIISLSTKLYQYDHFSPNLFGNDDNEPPATCVFKSRPEVELGHVSIWLD